MPELKHDLSNLSTILQDALPPDIVAAAQTSFLKELSLRMHAFYGGKMQTVPKAGIYGFNWFNVWYTPGVSKISTTIRDDNEASYNLSGRSNLVAVVSDSTRVLGDGDCTPAGGMGVMEGKSMLMKYLGACDSISLCVNSRDEKGKPNADKIIDFVKMLEPSVGAVNLEDISQPNCYRVLDALQEACDIPVWHDDAQGTACVTLAGLINALRLKKLDKKDAKVVLYGAGASNSTIARFLMQYGVKAANIAIFDSKGGLHLGRTDLQENPDKFKQWELAQKTNPLRHNTMEEAMAGADVLIALSTPGPNTIKPEWIRLMAPHPVVFACANPVPEIYPYDAHAAGAYIVATGRGDFPNQVNNSLGFPGILKGALMVRARKITDNMAIAAAHSLADFAFERDMHKAKILPNMNETEVFAYEAAAVAMQAIADGVARITMDYEEAFQRALSEIAETRTLIHSLMDGGFIQSPPQEILDTVLSQILAEYSS